MGRRRHPPEFRRKVLDLIEAGRPIAEVAQALGISTSRQRHMQPQHRLANQLHAVILSSSRPLVVSLTGHPRQANRVAGDPKAMVRGVMGRELAEI